VETTLHSGAAHLYGIMIKTYPTSGKVKNQQLKTKFIIIMDQLGNASALVYITLQQSLLCAFNTFDSIIPGISKDIYIMARTLKERSKNSPLLKKFQQYYNNVSTDNCTFSVSGNVNVNAVTKNIHCECDITYTTIHVPSQSEPSLHIIFEFLLNKNLSMKIKAMQHSSFCYSAYCLSHRQICSHGKNCINVSTYSPKSLLCNHKLSLKRVMGENI
jgi:hypothetical protein